MKRTSKTLLAGLLLASLTLGSAYGASLIIGDNFNVTGSGTGFGLGSGLNSGITSNATRLVGTAVTPGLRYFKAEGGRGNGILYITNSAKFGTSFGGNNALVSFSPDGSALANFGPALNTAAATPEVPALYELAIDIGNFTAGSGRISFGISSATGLPQNWDFGIEVYRNSTSETTYTIQKRIDLKSNGGALDTNSQLTNNVGAFGQELSFLFRITDAGAESTTFNSRVELALVGLR